MFEQGTVGPLTFTYPTTWQWVDVDVGSEGAINGPLTDLEKAEKGVARIWVSQARSNTTLAFDQLDHQFIGESIINHELILGQWYRASFHLLDSADATLLGLPARRYTYTAEWHSITVHGITVQTSVHNRIIRVTMYTTSESLEKKYMPVLEGVLSSLAYSTDGPAPRIKHGLTKTLPVQATHTSGVGKSVSSSSAGKTKTSLSALRRQARQAASASSR